MKKTKTPYAKLDAFVQKRIDQYAMQLMRQIDSLTQNAPITAANAKLCETYEARIKFLLS